MEVSALVQQMHENLSAIHETISGLTTESHNALLTELEQKRETLLEELRAAFDKEQEEVNSKRQQELDEIKEKRRIEDEEREARRKQEDEDLQSKNDVFDLERHEKLDGDIKQIDEDTDKQMDEVEAAARKVIEDARSKLSELEEKRKEINRLIDEQLQLPLPEVPTRKRARAEKSDDPAQSGEEPASKEVVDAEAASAEPESTEPEGAEPESAAPESAEPESAEPEGVEPEEAAAESAEPESLELVKAEEPVDATNNGDEQPGEATGEPASMQDPSVVEEQTDNNDKALESETPLSSEETDLPEEGGEDDADIQQQDGEEENPGGLQLRSLQVADSGVGLDPEVEAESGKSQPASPSGSEFRDVTGDGSTKESEFIANDMAGSPDGEQEEALERTNPLEPEAAVDANADLNTSQSDPIASCETQTILSEPAPEPTSSNSADEGPVDASPSPEEHIPQEPTEIDMTNAQPDESAPTPLESEVPDVDGTAQTATDESEASGQSHISKELDAEEQGDDASGAELTEPIAETDESVTIKDLDASNPEKSYPADDEPLSDADQADSLQPVTESSESVEIEQPGMDHREHSVHADEPESAAMEPTPVVEVEESTPVEQSESAAAKSISPAEEEEAESNLSSAPETAQSSDAMVSDSQGGEPGTDDSELPDEISREHQGSVSHDELAPAKEESSDVTAADVPELDQASSDAAKEEIQPDLHAELPDAQADAGVEQQSDSSVSKPHEEVEVAAEQPQESISDSTPQAEPVEEIPAIAETESEKVEDPQSNLQEVAIESDAQPDLQEVAVDAAVDHSDNSTVSQIPEEEAVTPEKSEEGIPDSTQAEPVEETLVAEKESDPVGPDSQPDVQEGTVDAVVEESSNSSVPQIPEEEAGAAEEPQEDISDSTAQVESVDESPVTAEDKSDAVESDPQPNLQEVAVNAAVDQSDNPTDSQIPGEEAAVAEKSGEAISDSTPVEPVEESPAVDETESDTVQENPQPDSLPDGEAAPVDAVADQSNSSTVSQIHEEEAVVAEKSEDVSDSNPQAEPVAEEPVTEEPVTEEPVAEEPVAKEPVTEEPIAEEPIAGEPVAEEPIAEEPIAEEPIAEEPIAEEPIAEEPVAEEPVAKEPVTEEPVAEEAIAEEPVAEEPVAEEPVAEEPVAEKPVAEKPVAEEPIAEEPVAKEPVAEEPVAEEAVAEEPVAKEPVAEESVAGEPVTEELVIAEIASETAKEEPQLDSQSDVQEAKSNAAVDQSNDSSISQTSEADVVIAEQPQNSSADSAPQVEVIEEHSTTTTTPKESDAVEIDANANPKDISADSIDQPSESNVALPSEAEEVGAGKSQDISDSTQVVPVEEGLVVSQNETETVQLDAPTDADQPSDSILSRLEEAEKAEEVEEDIPKHSEEAIADSDHYIDIVAEDSVISHSHDGLASTAEAKEIEGSESSLSNEEMPSDGDHDKSLMPEEEISRSAVDADEDGSCSQPANVELNSSTIEEPHHGNSHSSHEELEPTAVRTNEEDSILDHASALNIESESIKAAGETSLSSLPEKSPASEDEDHTHHTVNKSESGLDLDQSTHESRIDEQVGTTPKPRMDLDSSLPSNTLSDDSWQSEPSGESNQRPSSPEEQQSKGISGEEQNQKEGDSHSAERDDSVEPGAPGGPFDSTYVDEDYSLYSISNYADDSLDDGQNMLGHYRRDEHGQAAARQPVMDRSGMSAEQESADESSRNLVVDTAPRQTTRSPLPVENVTVQGQDDLFDDSTASSHFSDEEDSEIIDSGYPEQRFVRDIHPAPLTAVSYDGAGWGDEDITDEMENEHPGATETIQQPTPTQSQFDFANSFGIRMVKDAEQRRDSGFGIRMVQDAEQQHDLKPEPRAQTPSLTPFSLGNSQEVSPLVLQGASPMTPNSSRGGLASSRHAPGNDPQTPTRRLEPLAPEVEADFDPSLFMPRDVTNVPWHARNDSEPYSMRSQSTVSSAMSSPVHSALPIDKHEPVIRDSWHMPIGNGERSRANTQLTDRSSGEDFDPFKYDSARPTSYDINSPRRSVQVHQPITEPSRNSIAGSPMFQKLRNMFEPPAATSSSSSGRSSPTRSRPVSSIFHPVGRDRSSSQLRESHVPHDLSDSPRKGGFLNEHEDEIDEHSALLQNPEGHSDH